VSQKEESKDLDQQDTKDIVSEIKRILGKDWVGMNVKKARKKPVEIEFMQFKDMGNVDDIETWTNLKAVYDYGNDGKIMYIDTLEGVMTANIGDYIVKGLNGEFYPVKPDVFEKSYEVIGKWHNT